MFLYVCLASRSSAIYFPISVPFGRGTCLFHRVNGLELKILPGGSPYIFREYKGEGKVEIAKVEGGVSSLAIHLFLAEIEKSAALARNLS